MADLHAFVIPPLQHVHKSLKFSCSGEGLLKDDIAYDPHLERFLPPKATKSNPHPKEVERKSLAYWKAQCAFRGLNQSGAIGDLQLRLREAKKKILPELKTAETELNKEFKKRLKAANDGKWNSLKKAEQKAKANPSKYLAEAFPKGATGRPANMDIVVLKSPQDVRLALATAAGDSNLETVSVDAPWTGGKKPSPDRWIIIGRTRDAVWNQMREIEKEAAGSNTGGGEPKAKKAKVSNDIEISAARSKTLKAASSSTSKAPVTQKPKRNEPHVAEAPQKKQTAKKTAFPESSLGESEHQSAATKPRAKQTARKSVFQSPPPATESMQAEASSSKVAKGKHAWDVRGSWLISCPEIEDGWGYEGGDPSLTLDIYFEKKNGHHQMYAIFHFRIITGVMRFEKPIPNPKSEKSGTSNKRKREVDGDGDIYMADLPSYSGGTETSKRYTVSDFYLAPNDNPTARRPTWRYRWRGEETGEGEIQLESDETTRQITFSNKGNELSGTFKCDFIGECHFTGVKTSEQAWGSRVDPEEQWTNRSQDAYNYANISGKQVGYDESMLS
ncbi:hypothetical protein LOCC1_G002940 [Lachnellula occidentalis]|uniref:Uncharacterized protein n=1 Tax=Lachnellula occidentalis TaxID=215460 RepID=A0A8H8UJY8_9HELO|nr:hypothetical protein LOCC1_G002940 [Lachnellula occidentalis]